MKKRTAWIAGTVLMALGLVFVLRWANSPDEVVFRTPPPIEKVPPPVEAVAPPVVAGAVEPEDERPHEKTYEDLPQQAKDLPWAVWVDPEDYKLTPYYKVHIKCGVPIKGAMDAYKASSFYSMSFETKNIVANTYGDGLQGCANWHVANKYAASENHDEAKYHALLGSLILDSAVPLMNMMTNYYSHTKARDTLIPYTIFAIDRWPDSPTTKGWQRRITDEERAEFAKKVEDIHAFAERLEQEDIPQHN